MPLYLVSTPIGNLGDMSPRAVQTLENADVIAAEDTRHSLKLLTHFGIKTRLISNHEHNEKQRASELVDMLLEGMSVAVISDAGMPLVSDPGAELVRVAAEHDIEVICVPGACAALTALCVSGLGGGRFYFEGFLPRDKSRAAAVKRVSEMDCTCILYESPHHLARTLEDLAEVIPERRIALCRELTKLHEQTVRTTVAEAAREAKSSEPRGEYVLVIEAAQAVAVQEPTDDELAAEIELLIAGGMTKKSAIAETARRYKIGKNRVYRLANQ